MLKKIAVFVFTITLSSQIFTKPSNFDFNNRLNSNVFVFAEVYGFARYYYPRKKVNENVWEELVVKGLQMTYNCQNDDELIDSLNAYLSFVAPEILIRKKPLTDTLNSKELAKKRYYMEHHGFGDGKLEVECSKQKCSYYRLVVHKDNTAFIKTKLIGFLVNKAFDAYKSNLKKEKPKDINKYFSYNQDNICLNIPLYTTKKHKLKKGKTKNYLDKNEQFENIASLVIAWNIFKHFYPYQEEVANTWESILKKSLNIYNSTPNDLGLQFAIQHLISETKDGHADVYYKYNDNSFYADLKVKIINNKLYLSKDFDEDLRKGTEIIKINGKNIFEIKDSIKQIISYSTEQLMNRKIESMVFDGKENSSFVISYTNNGISISEKNVTCNKYSYSWLNEEKTNCAIKLLQDSIYLLDINYIEKKEFEKNIDNINMSKGLIMDYRGYPYRVGANLLTYFTDTSLSSPIWQIQISNLRNIHEKKFNSQTWSVEPAKRKINVPVVFLINSNAMSGTETSLDIVKHHKLGKLIGEPSAGANGNITGFTLKNRTFYCVFTGMKVINNNGEPATKGIEPDIYVPVTAEGLKNNKDEILEAAIEYIKNLDK